MAKHVDVHWLQTEPTLRKLFSLFFSHELHLKVLTMTEFSDCTFFIRTVTLYSNKNIITIVTRCSNRYFSTVAESKIFCFPIQYLM